MILPTIFFVNLTVLFMCDIILIFTIAQKIVQLFQQAVFETILICKRVRDCQIFTQNDEKTFFVLKNRFKFRHVLSAKTKHSFNEYLRKIC